MSSRYFNYFYANFKILLKSYREYKINIFVGLMQEILFHSIMLIGFLYVINISFGGIIGWTYQDFLLFGILVGLVDDLGGLFLWRKGLYTFIKTGMLNQFLIRPIHPFFGYYFSNLNSKALISVFVDISLFLTITFYFNIEYKNIFLSIFVLIFLVLLRAFLSSFNRSIAFFSLGLGSIFYEIKESFNETTAIYPAKFFDELKGKFILYLFAYFYVGLLLIPLLRGYTIINFQSQFILLSILVLILLFGTIFFWHFGLKRYEAFG